MRNTRGRAVRVGSLADLDRRLAHGAHTLASWQVHDVDLDGRVDDLLARDVAGAAFIGCRLAAGDGDRLTAAGALVLPRVGDVPFDVHRSQLYTADELYDTTPYAATLDARAYAWTQAATGREDTLAAALHDHAIDDALTGWIARHGRSGVVGVMGGHAADRGEPGYLDAARLGAGLSGVGLVVATGGGPGAMEAANLGARLGPDADLERAVRAAAATTSFRPSVDAWVATARDALAVPHEPRATLGVPTWHYGHEPPNLFATAIAKYVRNAVREAVLLQVCDAGIVFLPGAAGTVQEVFQDGCENYYADEASVAPMVLVDRVHWTERLPAWPLLRALATDRAMAAHVHLVDTVEEAVDVIAARTPRAAGAGSAR